VTADADGRVVDVFLQGSPFEDGFLKLLDAHPGIRSLHLSRTAITTQGLTRMTWAHRLETLTFDAANANDSALRWVMGLPNLKELRLGHAYNVTPDAIRKLQQARPKLKIILHDRPPDQGPTS
jgi:hypothetical protein